MGQIRILGISKAYKHYKNQWLRFFEWIIPFCEKKHELVWILQDINISVQSGEAVGIVGVNGAGKSTLLKLISGTAQPTTGKITISGRVSALLELGMGFHPDFTGRQNVAMAAQLMGLNSEEISSIMPQVEEFAEIGEYIDQPVRVYSSGMQVRLAFSVATVRRPDVLIVDEALSVGDAYFQHKSFNRIQEFRKQGTTLFIVSHDKGVIQTLCDRAILLSHGRILKEGQPVDVMDFYNAMIAEKEDRTVKQEVLQSGNVQTTSGTGEASVESIALYNTQGKKIENVKVGEHVKLQIRVKVHADIESLVLGYVIKDRLGRDIYGTNTWFADQIINGAAEGDEFQFEIEFPVNLGVGSYSIAIALHEGNTHINANYCWRDLALIFNVINTGKIQFTGCNWIEPNIDISKI